MAESQMSQEMNLEIFAQQIAQIQAQIDVLSKHIAVLEKCNRSFADRFKFGRFKPKNINDDMAKISSIPAKRFEFNLND